MDFRGQRLRGVGFNEAFLITTDFSRADLTGASFAGSFIRNVNFTDAVLDGVDFTGADWFNSQGLTADQLGRARRETVLPCPRGAQACKKYLASHYVYKFDDYDAAIQEQLLTTWAEYRKNGGLCASVSAWSSRGQE
jgi:hypothetical protein